MVVKAGVSALFLLFLAKWVDWEVLWEAAGNISRVYFLVSCGIVVCCDVLIAVRLRCLMRPTCLSLPLWRLVRINYAARFYAIFLPAGIGQAVVRWYKVTENKYGQIQFVVVSVVEKSLFFMVTLLFVGVPLLFSSDPRIEHIRVGLLPVLGTAAAILGCLYVLLASESLLRLAEPLTLRIRTRVVRGLPRVGRLIDDLGIFRGRAGILLAATLLSCVIQILIAVRISLLCRAVGVTLPWLNLLWVSSFVFFIQVMPVSFAGVGVRETAFAYTFGLYALGREAGALVGVLFFAQMLVLAGIGGLLEIADRGGRAAPSDGSTEQSPPAPPGTPC